MSHLGFCEEVSEVFERDGGIKRDPRDSGEWEGTAQGGPGGRKAL